MKWCYKGGLVPTDLPLCPFAQGEALSFLFRPSQFSSGEAVRSSPAFPSCSARRGCGDEGFDWRLGTRDDCFPVADAAPLVSPRSIRAAWCEPAEHRW